MMSFANVIFVITLGVAATEGFLKNGLKVEMPAHEIDAVLDNHLDNALESYGQALKAEGLTANERPRAETVQKILNALLREFKEKTNSAIFLKRGGLGKTSRFGKRDLGRSSRFGKRNIHLDQREADEVHADKRPLGHTSRFGKRGLGTTSRFGKRDQRNYWNEACKSFFRQLGRNDHHKECANLLRQIRGGSGLGSTSRFGR